MTHAVLSKLGLQDVNPGACFGPDGWRADPQGQVLISYNPATGEPLARIVQATAHTYSEVIRHADDSFRTWREVPAPKRGLVVRDLGDALKAQGPLDAYDEISAHGKGTLMSVVRQHLKGCCAGCAVPAGIFKGMQVAAGLALPKDAVIRLTVE